MIEITTAAVIDLSLQFTIAVLYGFVALKISQRKVSAYARMPNQAFAAWWWALAVLSLANVLRGISLWFVEPNLARFTAYIHFVLLVIMLGFAGLVFYFLYLKTLKQSVWVPVFLFYMAVYIFFVYFIALQEPSGFDAEGQLVYANDLADSTLSSIVGVVWLLPPIIGAALHLGLVRKFKEPLLRFRIAAVSSSTLAWFLISLGGSLGGAEGTAWGYVSRIIAAIVAIITLVAYNPPVRLEKWLNRHQPVAEELQYSVE